MEENGMAQKNEINSTSTTFIQWVEPCLRGKTESRVILENPNYATWASWVAKLKGYIFRSFLFFRHGEHSSNTPPTPRGLEGLRSWKYGAGPMENMSLS